MSKKKTDEQFREEVEELTGDEYTVLEEYKTNATKINFKHNTCGYVFPMAPVYFLNGNRCPFCARAARKKTNEQFLQEVEKLVGDEYTFFEPYMNNSTKLLCRHNACGYEWEVTPGGFLFGRRCPKCAGNMKKTSEQFLQEVKKLVGDEYTFLEPYMNNYTKILCRHNVCGHEWEITPSHFLHGHMCPKCANVKKSIDSLASNEDFLKRVHEIVGSEYSFLDDYVDSRTKLTCRHNTCGYEWKVTPNRFSSGGRCPKCANILRSNALSKTNEEFLQEVEFMRGDEYTFLEKYAGSNVKINCRHNKCGYIWKITPNHFFNGRGCPKCGGTQKLTDAEFKAKVKSLTGDEYTFLEEYTGAMNKILCRHNTCGHVWKTRPSSYIIEGKRCPECAHSAFLGEVDIRAYLNKHGITYVHDISIRELFIEHLGYSRDVYSDFISEFVESINTLDDKTGFGKMIDRFHISRARFDFYIFSDENKKKLAGLIEYDGEQHFKFTLFFFRTLKEFAYRHGADRVKNSFAEFFNIPLIRIAYFQKDQINAMLDDFFTRPEYYRTQHNTYLTNEEYEACFDETNVLADMKDFKFET